MYTIFEHAFHFRFYIGRSHDTVNPESVSFLAVPSGGPSGGPSSGSVATLFICGQMSHCSGLFWGLEVDQPELLHTNFRSLPALTAGHPGTAFVWTASLRPAGVEAVLMQGARLCRSHWLGESDDYRDHSR